MYTSPGASVSEITTKFGQCSTHAAAESNPGQPGCEGADRAPRAFHRFRVDQPVTGASQVGTVTERPAQATTLAAREVAAQKPIAEEKPQAHDGRSKHDELNHDGCESGGIHTDACWNDPRWDESNKAGKALLADRIANGDYSLEERYQAEIFDGKYRADSSAYHDQHTHHQYCNYKITRCSDNKVLANINKTDSSPSWDCFKRNGEDWFVICHNSPVLVNLTTEETFEQRGDHYCSDDPSWYSAEVSPDGNTLLAGVNICANLCHPPLVNQFYDFSHPEQGFRQLPTDWLEEPDWGDGTEWDTDQDNNTTVTLDITSDGPDDEIGYDNNNWGSNNWRSCCGQRRHQPPRYQVTLRRMGNQMVEINRKAIGKEKKTG